MITTKNFKFDFDGPLEIGKKIPIKFGETTFEGIVINCEPILDDSIYQRFEITLETEEPLDIPETIFSCSFEGK